MTHDTDKIKEIYHLWVENGYAYTTDSRKINPGDIFFALHGENFDGNDFALKALELGARAVVVDDSSRYSDNDRVFVVKDTLLALQSIARLHRQTMGIPVLSLTGSNGKTTSKELISRVLAKKYTVCATRGNLNNHIGVPMTLLSIRPEHDFAVVEMGASHPHEIAELSEIACPDYGYITNFGRAHLEGFGGVEGVIRTKSELYDYLRSHSGTAIVNADDPVQMKQSDQVSRYLFSSSPDTEADVHIQMLSSLPHVTGQVSDVSFSTHLSGEYNFTNAAAAVAIGTFFGIDKNDIADALYSYLPSNNRSQWIQRGPHAIMMDAYNANPTSMSLSIRNFAAAPTQQSSKIAVLGDMFELGEYAHQEHQDIASLVASLPYEQAYLIGKNFSLVIGLPPHVHTFESFEAFAQGVKIPQTPCAFLVKGSRGMAMERFLDLLKE